ncbi:MAG: hypothetical protein KF773_16905 [Deltaproteobacteria bacterium]|nr:hypothetical protein [Deltaproteobacteria bacterium]
MIERVRNANALIEYVDLARIDSRRTLEDRVRPLLEAPEDRLRYAFFDDLEKCQLSAIERHLDDILGVLALKNVRVRIAYRAGTLSGRTEQRYGELFGGGHVCDLLPLTRRAVLTVLGQVRQPADDLLRGLEQQDLVPLLIQPVTLRMISALVAANRPIHAMTRRELYEQSCRLLCTPRPEESETLEIDERMAVAARLAAISVFCNRPMFGDTVAEASMPSAFLPIGEVIRGQEPLVRGDMVAVNMGNVREVLLRTGLFSAVGKDLVGWWHNSIADFLAGQYVRAHNLPTRQVIELLRLADPTAPILPQLEGVIAWLIEDERLGLVARVMARSPLTLVRSDVSQFPESLRREIIHLLLEAAQREMISVWGDELPRRIARAAYPTLLSELVPWIQDRQRNQLARVLAIRLAEACGLGAALSDALLAIALDVSETLDVRHQAVIVLREHGSRSARLGLRPLAIASDPGDVRDDLKGNALRALWPSELTSAELFSALTRQRDETYMGAYEVFLVWHLPRSLLPTALPDALGWVLHQPPLLEFGVTLRLVDAILRTALQYLCDDTIRGLVADVFVRRLRVHAGILTRSEVDKEVDLKLLVDPEQRRSLIEAMVDRIEAADPVYMMISSEPSPLAGQDVRWLLERLRLATDFRVNAWLRMIDHVVPDTTEDDRQVLLGAMLEDERLRGQLRWFAGEVELGSRVAQEMRDAYELRQRRTAQRVARGGDDTVVQTVAAAATGDMDAFSRLYSALSGRPGRSLGVDVTSLPGWKELNAEQRQRLVEIAREYLVLRDDRRAEWLGRGSPGQDALAGLRAIHLIASEGVEVLVRLPNDVWSRWVGILVAWPFRQQSSDDVRRIALECSLRAAPDQVTDVVRALLTNHDGSVDSTLEDFPDSWPLSLVDLVVAEIRTRQAGAVDGLLSCLFAVAPTRAEAVAWELASDARRGLTTRARALSAMVAFGGSGARERALSEGVEPLRPLTHAVFARLAQSRTLNVDGWSDNELATLYIALERRYPSREDPDIREMHIVRTREMLANMRRGVLAELQGRATRTAVAAFRTIATALEGQPNAPFLRRTLAMMEVRAAQTEWQPPTPDMLLALVEDATRSFAEVPEELGEMVVESLRRLDQRLNGCETPMAELLWNIQDTATPKDETALSNLIRNHLVGDLVERRLVINREVEVHPASTGLGRRPDVHIVGVRPDGIQLTVYVEVKRCDNRNRGDAIESQLIQQYLRPTSNRVGIYVVGHYDCNARTCCAESRDEIWAALKTQAQAVASDYTILPVILDTSLPTSMTPRPRPSQRAQDRDNAGVGRRGRGPTSASKQAESPRASDSKPGSTSNSVRDAAKRRAQSNKSPASKKSKRGNGPKPSAGVRSRQDRTSRSSTTKERAKRSRASAPTTIPSRKKAARK